MKSSSKRKPAVKLSGKVEEVIPSRYEPDLLALHLSRDLYPEGDSNGFRSTADAGRLLPGRRVHVEKTRRKTGHSARQWQKNRG